MWRDIYIKSGEFIGPYLTGNFKAFPLTFDHISDALDGARRDKGTSKLNYFRGYVEGKEDYVLAERFLMYDLTPLRIEKSIFEAFGGDKPGLGKSAGLIVNGALQWSDMLHEVSRINTRKIALLYPDQQFTFDITLFIGAYGTTPFGVHIDDASHRTILFNLGPGDKGIALWQDEDILKQFGMVHNVLDPASIEAAPKKYFFKSGEAFILPSKQYHIGLNSTLSTVVAIVIDILSAGKAAAREAQNIGSFFDAMPETKKRDVRNISFAELVHLNSLRNSSNHYLRYSLTKIKFDISTITDRTKFRLSKAAGVKIFPLPHTAIVYSRGYHYIYEQTLDVSSFEGILRKDMFDVKYFLFSLGGRVAIKSKLSLLKFLIETGTLEVLQ